ncbi:hypothetical protein M422DRAFT_242359 [Sphaerobolus stellatus SS14]|nr:hypothetical protein M422DRAFT_242359 [Sphaerobolus stellatus SS14]
MFDPPYHDTTIGEVQKLGIKVKILTGDAVAIAKETCRMLSLGTNVYDFQRLIGGNLAGSDIHDFVEGAEGSAEVFPEHKYQVVRMLRARGHLTAMIGDGTNDVPSLKAANCGIAVEGASDAAKSATDVVFLDPDLATIITSIKVSRQIFHRMKVYIQYRVALCLHLEIYLLSHLDYLSIFFTLVQPGGERISIEFILGAQTSTTARIVPANILHYILTAFTQGFYAVRIWHVTKRKGALFATVVFLSFSQFAAGIAGTVNAAITDSVFSVYDRFSHITQGIASGSSLLCDIIITVSLVRFLQTRWSALQSTRLALDKMVISAVNIGLLTSIFAILILVTVRLLVSDGAVTVAEKYLVALRPSGYVSMDIILLSRRAK